MHVPPALVLDRYIISVHIKNIFHIIFYVRHWIREIKKNLV